MTTITLHCGPPTPGAVRARDQQLVTGLMIDHAAALGWDQGFEPGDDERFAWQVQETACAEHPRGALCAVQVSLPRRRGILPPYAGIVVSAEEVWRRLGHENPRGYSFCFRPSDTSLAEPEGTALFRSAPAGPECSATVTLHRAGEPGADVATGPGALAGVLGHAPDLLTGIEVLPVDPAPPPQDLLEYAGTPWHPVEALACRLREWSPAMAGAVASTVVHGLQDPLVHVPLRVGLHLARASRVTPPEPTSA